MMKKNKRITKLTPVQKKALQQICSGKSPFGPGGAYQDLVKNLIEIAMEGEMDFHIAQDKGLNKRNGKKRKTLKSSFGNIEIRTPQDRNSTFEPQIVRKRQTLLVDSLADKITGLYGIGMSYRDIQSELRKMYSVDLSLEHFQAITDRIISELNAWKERNLDAVYPIIYMDAAYFKVKENGKVKTKALSNVLAITDQGKKEVLGIYIKESEGASTWLSILADLKNRGVKDVLIVCIDNVKGFSEAIESTFPETEVQLCTIHQIRNSLRYVATKDKKAFVDDLKSVYKAANKASGEEQLNRLEKIWGKKYPIVIRSWKANWEKLSTYFAYTPEIRRLIYTTNPIENYHRQVRKVTKTKGAFPSDIALLKLVYLASKNIQEKWNRPVHHWSLINQQLVIRFADRMPNPLIEKI